MIESLVLLPAAESSRDRRFAFLELGTAIVFFLILIGLKFPYAVNQPWDSDEPQHLHVVWAWTSGLLPYRDIFDNHAPLFQALSAPVFALFGERADIVTVMRWAITPVAILILVMTYLLGRRLFSKRVGLWGTILAACFPDFYFKLDEYRPDLFWCAIWLLLLTILTYGKLTPRRLFWAGFTLGIAFAVSMKTTFLLLTILLAAVTVWLVQLMMPSLRLDTGKSPRILSIATPLAGTMIVPFCVIGFFGWQGALNQMYYCVIAHNITASGGQVADFLHRTRDLRFWLFIPMIAGGIWLAKRDPDHLRGLQRLFLLAVTGLYCPLLFSFWPLISKQDYLPFYPIYILVLAFPLVWAGEWLGSKSILPAFLLPAAVAILGLIWLTTIHPPLKPANRTNFAIISDVLKLTQPGETVLDGKGQAIYRRRAFYYVLEQITRERAERGELRDDTPEKLEAYGTAVVVPSHWLTQETDQFVSDNYIAVGPVLVLGKKIMPDKIGRFEFDLPIPAKYTIVGPHGLVSGSLDGMQLNGSRYLSRGAHDLVSPFSSGPVYVIWSRACEKGFSPF
jgi:4-amino-4-deoxy-L-arabinose transferase-like glycosyltransferase